MLKNIIFDLDGTILDSKKCIFEVFTMLFNELNIKVPSDEELESFIGPPVEDTLKKYVKDDAKKYCDRFRELYKKVDIFATNFPYEGIDKVIATLEGKYRLFVTTTKNEPLAKELLEGFGLDKYFENVYGSLDKIGRVDKADVINAALEGNALIKSECLLIGDTISDVDGAKLSGIKVALVKYGYGVEEDFVDKKIEFYADTALDILNKLEKYQKKNG